MGQAEEFQGFDAELFARGQFDLERPLVFRGACRDWALYGAAQAGLDPALRGLAEDLGDPEVEVAVLPPGLPLSFAYGEGLRRAHNWTISTQRFGAFVDRLVSGSDERLYIQGSLDLTKNPELARRVSVPMVNEQAMIGVQSFVRRFWIGRGRFAVPFHYDTLHNFACLAAGEKRFSLLPPHHLPALGFGPEDFTPNGAPTTALDFDHPEHLPEAAQRALSAATIAELEPGDVLYLPKYWLHRVESAGLSLMMNYWWFDASFEQMAAEEALFAAARLVYARASPAARRFWRIRLEHEALRNSGDPYAHLPAPHHERLEAGRDIDRARALAALTRVLGPEHEP